MSRRARQRKVSIAYSVRAWTHRHGEADRLVRYASAGPIFVNEVSLGAFGSHWSNWRRQICRARRLSIELLRLPSRARHLAAVRADLVSQSIEQRVATLSQAARFLNRYSSALGRLLARQPTKAKSQQGPNESPARLGVRLHVASERVKAPLLARAGSVTPAGFEPGGRDLNPSGRARSPL